MVVGKAGGGVLPLYTKRFINLLLNLFHVTNVLLKNTKLLWNSVFFKSITSYDGRIIG